jgi:vacuolar-type H+-ATPase subunit E/Vma4
VPRQPGSSNGHLRESSEEFAQRIGKELRGEANRILTDAQKRAKEIRKVASKFDGKRS